MDQPTCGKSEGLPRALIRNFEHFVDDVLDYAQQLRQHYGEVLQARRAFLGRRLADVDPGEGGGGPADPVTVAAAEELSRLPATANDIPFFLWGESFGGALSVLAAARSPVPFSGLILQAPLLALTEVSADTCQWRCDLCAMPSASSPSYNVAHCAVAASVKGCVVAASCGKSFVSRDARLFRVRLASTGTRKCKDPGARSFALSCVYGSHSHCDHTVTACYLH
jgi:pimeloyl-ACP methyl ester carboxylesterase